MTADYVQFVDSISEAPNVLLDLNDEETWFTRQMLTPLPRLRRAMSSNAMRDGVYVSSSQYEARVVTLVLDLVTTDSDTTAEQLQLLIRELDKPRNLLRYMPGDGSKPLFFRLYRSDVSSLERIRVASSLAGIQVELLAEPFALGLRETVEVGTVSNDPAAEEQGMFFDVSGVLGDVAVPAVIELADEVLPFVVLATRSVGTEHVFFVQAEDITLGADTSNPGGAASAVRSGSGSTNYVTTSFSGTGDAQRLNWMLSGTHTTPAQEAALIGRFRLWASVRRTDDTSEITVSSGDTRVELPLTEYGILVDLGDWAGSTTDRVGLNDDVTAEAANFQVRVNAQRLSGSGGLEWDYLLLIPADEQTLIWEGAQGGIVVVDGENDAVLTVTVGNDPFAEGAPTHDHAVSVGGSWPRLRPNATTRVYMVAGDTTDTAGWYDPNVARTHDVLVHYWPRYLYIRPASS